MKADFSGYASKAGLRCSDGRTIMPNAFQHQDKMRVPLVWQHGHTDVENVLGHAILENRDDGVYAYGFFNETVKGKHAKSLVIHGDINAMSIWANGLVEKASRVIHGAIREVSLVLSGANPGALIERVSIAHSDGTTDELDDEIIIHSGEELEVYADDEENEEIKHAEGGEEDGATIQEVVDGMTQEQKDVLNFLVGAALGSATDNTAAQSNLSHQEGTTQVMNVFEQGNKAPSKHVLSHDAMADIVKAGNRLGSLREAVERYAEEHLAHGITDIDQLFPDAQLVGDAPEWVKRRTEWVSELLGAVRKSPFGRIKTMSADITEEQARAKGYITGTLKKEEFFSVARRVTTPTTIYKKQALDRDDMIDITDFDVVAWLKFEMRLMLDEELARAILIGDGRDPSDEDKINEGNIRPIATDSEAYTTVVNVNVSDANSSMLEVLDAMLANRYKLKGTGTPNFYTTELWIARFLMLRDGDNKRMYKNLEELALEMRVARIVAVEPLQETPDIIGILVNPVDYVLGADKGGQVSMFDDFDIDYNKQKYLIETRCSGALAKLKSAMVINSVPSGAVLTVPTAPTFNPATGALTIVNTTGVVYKNGAGTTINAAGSPYTVAPGTTYEVFATPSDPALYYFADSDVDNWSFTADPA